MIEEPPLLSIKRPSRRPTNTQIAAFQNVPTSFVVDALYGGGALAAVIRPIGDGRDIDCRAAGPALTVDNGPGDILAVLAALGSIQQGDVVIAACDGYQGCAAAGDRVIGMCKNNGAIGYVTDGPVRDYTGIVAVNLPVWCTGLTPASPFAKGPGRVGHPVQIGGQHVATGDMVVADRDGVVIVPFDRIDEVVAMLERVTEMEILLDAEVAEGRKMPDSISELLISDQVSFVD